MSTDVDTAESLEELIRRAKQSHRAAKDAYARFSATRREHWQQLAGSAVEEMLQGREAAERFLSATDPHCRLVALEILDAHWRPDATLANAAERMALGDADPQVRTIALLTLGQCFIDVPDRRILRLFADILNDSAASNAFRRAAYLGICKMCRPLQDWPDPAAFRFPDEVDWDFVASAASQRE